MKVTEQKSRLKLELKEAIQDIQRYKDKIAMYDKLWNETNSTRYLEWLNWYKYLQERNKEFIRICQKILNQEKEIDFLDCLID